MQDFSTSSNCTDHWSILRALCDDIQLRDVLFKSDIMELAVHMLTCVDLDSHHCIQICLTCFELLYNVFPVIDNRFLKAFLQLRAPECILVLLKIYGKKKEDCNNTLDLSYKSLSVNGAKSGDSIGLNDCDLTISCMSLPLMALCDCADGRHWLMQPLHKEQLSEYLQKIGPYQQLPGVFKRMQKKIKPSLKHIDFSSLAVRFVEFFPTSECSELEAVKKAAFEKEIKDNARIGKRKEQKRIRKMKQKLKFQSLRRSRNSSDAASHSVADFKNIDPIDGHRSTKSISCYHVNDDACKINIPTCVLGEPVPCADDEANWQKVSSKRSSSKKFNASRNQTADTGKQQVSLDNIASNCKVVNKTCDKCFVENELARADVMQSHENHNFVGTTMPKNCPDNKNCATREENFPVIANAFCMKETLHTRINMPQYYPFPQGCISSNDNLKNHNFKLVACNLTTSSSINYLDHQRSTLTNFVESFNTNIQGNNNWIHQNLSNNQELFNKLSEIVKRYDWNHHRAFDLIPRAYDINIVPDFFHNMASQDSVSEISMYSNPYLPVIRTPVSQLADVKPNHLQNCTSDFSMRGLCFKNCQMKTDISSPISLLNASTITNNLHEQYYKLRELVERDVSKSTFSNVNQKQFFHHQHGTEVKFSGKHPDDSKYEATFPEVNQGVPCDIKNVEHGIDHLFLPFYNTSKNFDVNQTLICDEVNFSDEDNKIDTISTTLGNMIDSFYYAKSSMSYNLVGTTKGLMTVSNLPFSIPLNSAYLTTTHTTALQPSLSHTSNPRLMSPSDIYTTSLNECLAPGFLRAARGDDNERVNCSIPNAEQITKTHSSMDKSETLNESITIGRNKQVFSTNKSDFSNLTSFHKFVRSDSQTCVFSVPSIDIDDNLCEVAFPENLRKNAPTERAEPPKFFPSIHDECDNQMKDVFTESDIQQFAVYQIKRQLRDIINTSELININSALSQKNLDYYSSLYGVCIEDILNSLLKIKIQGIRAQKGERINYSRRDTSKTDLSAFEQIDEKQLEQNDIGTTLGFITNINNVMVDGYEKLQVRSCFLRINLLNRL